MNIFSIYKQRKLRCNLYRSEYSFGIFEATTEYRDNRSAYSIF